MISVDALIKQEESVLNALAKEKGGAWLARHVANRTAAFLAQETRKELLRLGCDEFQANAPARIIEAAE